MTTPALGLLQQELVRFCETHEIGRFSAEQMVELLEDGEEAGWIVEQVLTEGPPGKADELRTVLEGIAAQVAPASALSEADAADIDVVAGTELPSDVDVEAMLEDMELPPGVDRAQFEQLMSSPRGALLADFGQYCEEKGYSQESAKGFGGGTGGDDKLRELHEEWMQTPRDSLEGKRPSDMMSGGLFPEKVQTFRRESPKVGRNDPCPCGSGKKFKKCCGKG